MKNKGFTIMELMAVIVILGILTTLAAVGVTKYRQTVKEKELVNLHSTIEAAYD
ncbi:MAG: type II secretion system protein, partial [Bacilli bacterium]